VSAPQQQYLYQFSAAEKEVIDRRWQAYISAVQVIAELHGLQMLEAPLNTDPQNTGFLLPPGMEIKQGEQQQ